MDEQICIQNCPSVLMSVRPKTCFGIAVHQLISGWTTLGRPDIRMDGMPSLRPLAVSVTNAILDQIRLSEQNKFSNYVCTLLNYHLTSSDRIKPFHIKSMCSFE